MPRKPKSICITETFEVKAKNLRKGDSIWIGKRVYRLKSNIKNDFGQRVLNLRWGSNKKKDNVTLIISPKAMFVVRKATHNRTTV